MRTVFIYIPEEWEGGNEEVGEERKGREGGKNREEREGGRREEEEVK